MPMINKEIASYISKNGCEFTRLSNSNARSGTGQPLKEVRHKAQTLMERIFHIRLEVDSLTQVSNRTKVIGWVWRYLVLHRSQTRLQKTTICFRGVDNFYTGLKFSTRWLMIGRCLILHRPQTGGCGTVTYITFQRKVICHRVSNHAAKMHVIRPQTARTAATLPIRVWRYMVSHRSQTL